MTKLIHCAAVALVLAVAPPVPVFTQNFLEGVRAYEKGDYTVTLRELTPLAEQGHVEAQLFLAEMYFSGESIARDYAKSARWYHMAAEQGDALAQSLLGTMYYGGLGVRQDYVIAHMWSNIAHANGSESGSLIRSIVAVEMSPADILEAQRRARVCIELDYQDCD